MNTLKKLCLISMAPALSLTVLTSHASEREPGYDASASLGYVGTSGNTDSQTLDTQLRYTLRTTGGWVHNARFQALYAEQDSVTSGERYLLEGKSDYRIGQRGYVFGKGSYTDDRFTGYDYQASLAGGYGHYFSNTDELFIEAFVGAGYRHNALAVGPDDGEAIISMGQNIEWAFTDSTSLNQSLLSEIGDDLTVSRFEISLVSNIIGQLATKIAFQARHISQVPAGRKKTDTQTSVSLVYTSR